MKTEGDCNNEGNIFYYLYSQTFPDMYMYNSMEMSPSWEVVSCGATQEFYGTRPTRERAMNKGNTTWTPQYENSVSEVWVYILKPRRRAIVERNMDMRVGADAVRRFQSINSCLRMDL
jgi:hypothetical protein